MSKKRAKIEEIAARSVQNSGLHNLSFRSLANDVGIKSSSIHYHFPEKSHLATALIENYTAAFIARLQEIDEQKLTLGGKLDAFIQIFEDVIKANRLCLCGMMAAEVSTLDKDNRIILGHYFTRSEQWIEQLLSNNPDEIEIAITPRKLSKVIMSGLEGAILIDRVDGGLERLHAQRELIRQLIQ